MEHNGIKYTVTVIEEYGFYKKHVNDADITSVVIPDTVTTIGSFSFTSSKIKTIYIPDSVVLMGQYVFSASSIETVYHWSKNLTSIPRETFSSSKINNLDWIPDTVTKLDYGAFARCNELEGDIIIPESINTLGNYAFASCINATSFTGNGVTSVQNWAFALESIIPNDSSLKFVSLPNLENIPDELMAPNANRYISNLILDKIELACKVNGETDLDNYIPNYLKVITRDGSKDDTYKSLGLSLDVIRTHVYSGWKEVKSQIIVKDGNKKVKEVTMEKVCIRCKKKETKIIYENINDSEVAPDNDSGKIDKNDSNGDSGNDNKNAAKTNNDENTKQNTKTPNTSDVSNLPLYGGMIIIALGGMGFVLKRKYI